ncbi:choice-of-anchor L domain-containing protein [Winogradskyella maritima]|uniref:Choice-of-anchor L domain-containing protein n=1 Tax=Winogradskyella maritima TaxID=1517766 RepID=A0ABV8AKK1_9FLAO|nr:choice-of-anchor L domain-containing protein [Winogradskyella maritima]
MRYTLLLFSFFFLSISFAQNISVDSQSFTPQQLIEDILIDSDCITGVSVTNVVGGNFNGTDQSYGFFDATGTTFPFQSGIVMSTGRLANVPGPNTTLSDDNASNWEGDNDLETILNETGTTNATIIEFDFTAVASAVSFRYIFASEEYQENNPNSCNFSDLFGFLIRPSDGQNQFENIALVPDTDIPVKATTVTPGVPGSCPPQNETYFGMYNGNVSPINFNGQTAILTANAEVLPGESYSVKLVIADEQNFRFDSAVFLEAGSFQLSTDLGLNRLVATNNPVCEGESVILDATLPGQNGYDWFRDGVLVQSDPIGCTGCGTFTATEAGFYNVEVTLANNCEAFGEVTLEYAENPIATDTALTECDFNQDGLTTYDLNDAFSVLTGDNPNLVVSGYFTSLANAMNNVDVITNVTTFENTSPNQIIYARVINQANCFDIGEVELRISTNTVDIPDLEVCDRDDIDGISIFDLTDIQPSIQNQIPPDAFLTFYETAQDAELAINALGTVYENTEPNQQTIFVRVENDFQCFAISEATLVVLFTPTLMPDETVFYCVDTFPEPIELMGGVLNDLPNNYFYDWEFNGMPTDLTTSTIEVNETGTYTVTVTDPNGCSSSRTIIVLPSERATISGVNVDGIGNTNTVTISVTGSGDYEFALDNPNGDYQDENTFINITPGFHTVYVRDKNGCGITEQVISVLGFPKYFTPNGDSNHDFWQVAGVNFELYPQLVVTIFDRFGKLIQVQNSRNSGWDGSYKGLNLPSSDYWFTAEFGDGRSFSGHFALKR